MNTKTHNTLSSYQRAVLGELGIATWQAQSPESLNTETPTQNVASNIQAPNKVANKKTSPIPDAIKRFKTQPDEAPVRKSVPNSVVLGFNLASVPSSLVKDVLLSIELPTEGPELISKVNSAEYSDYLLAWDIDEKVALKGRLLTTPPLNKGLSVANKKQLWTFLSRFSLNDT
ncbi:hypothetical protein FX988_01347 [Paraglaciecola mesophila]|uniref:Uncharacterized protein n=1 Tax=Paraglaciecola mesophila TaxID=197222 RepID=A0A857JGL7_9ALTE|nr:DNA polymerase III subunit psi [Paraglaciecola mesophila]QHJ11125.1 hypothetical protein FX988_01347 [Paraglaciecola mesophila]